MSSDAKNNLRKRLLRKYARLNLAVLPITRPMAGRSDSGKKPILKGGYKSAVIGKREIERLFKAYPESNIGIATGCASGVLVLDVDPRHSGNKTLLTLEKTLGILPPTWEAATSRGGRHLYFKLPSGMKLARDTSGRIFGNGLDVLCEGSIAVCPPSRHATGHTYSWKKQSDLDSSPAALPRRWLRHLETAIEARRTGASSPNATATANNAIPAGRRNSTLFRFACGWRAGGDGPEQLYERLKEVNRERCHPPLEKQTLKEMAERVAEKYRAEPSTNLPSIIADSTLADRFANGRHLLFHGGQFYQYGATHWTPISEDHLKNSILAQIRGLAKQAHIKTASLMSEVVSILKADQVALTDPFGSTGDPLPIINCLNGEVWLGEDGSAELRPHRPDSGQLHTLKVNYDPEAECPEYDTATKQIFSNGKDPDRLARYWDELFGYTIQPSRPHAIIVILLGEGGNGKTKLAETIMRLLGPEMVYSGRIEEIESNRFTIGALKDKRLFLDDDVRARIRLPDGVLKRLSEGKRITGEEKYKSPVTFDLRAFPMLLCNNIPSLNDISPGMKRRLQVIPFDKSFKGPDQDKMLFERIWANEMSGVLNRALRGWQRLKRRGDFKVPGDVRLATAKWIQDANPFSTFLDDTVVRDPTGRTPLGKVFARFLEWSKAAGVQRTLTRLQLRHDLQHEGYDIRKSNGEVVVRGLVLKH